MACVADPRAIAWTAAVKARFPCSRYAGTCACRHIIPHDGGSSSTWSEHSWGNAVDFGGSSECQASIVQYAQDNKRLFGIDNIIPPGSSVNVVHVDFFPNHSGKVPSCAGGSSMAPTVGGPNTVPLATNGATANGVCPPGSVSFPIKVNGKKSYGCASPQDALHHGPDFGGWLQTVQKWAEIAGGGILLLVGVGVAIAGGTGAPNPATAAYSAASSRLSGRRSSVGTVSDQEYYERRGMERASRQSGAKPTSYEGLGERLPRKRREAGE